MKRNEILGEISDRTLKNYRQGAHTEIQGAKFGKGKGTPEGEKTIAKREKGMASAAKRQQARSDAEKAKQPPREKPKTSSGPQDWYGQNRYMGDSVEEGAELKKVKRDYNQAAKDAGGDWAGAGKKIDNMKKGLRQKDIDNKKAQSVAEAMPMAGQAGEITDMQPGKSVTVSAPSSQPGVTSMTQVDLTKNPAALSKNEKGELVLKMTPAQGGAPDATKELPPQKGTAVKFESDLSRLKHLAGGK